jgi:hypothetical protein
MLTQKQLNGTALIAAKSGYSKPEFSGEKMFRVLTLDEVKELTGEFLMLTSNRILRARTNGKVKTWKRNLGRVEVPCKYGFKHCFTIYYNDGIPSYLNLAVPVVEVTINP